MEPVWFDGTEATPALLKNSKIQYTVFEIYKLLVIFIFTIKWDTIPLKCNSFLRGGSLAKLYIYN